MPPVDHGPAPSAAHDAVPDFGFEFEAMATHCRVRIAGLPEPEAHAAADAAIDEVRRIEARYSRYRSDSVVASINAAAGGAPLEVDEETADLLDYAALVFADSGGRFDITTGVLRRAWDFKAARLPAPGAIEALLPQVGWSRLRWQRPWLHLPQAGMEIDFGGLGKEYAADRAAAAAQARGAGSGFVNLGGDIRVIGPRPDGRPWRFGIAHPRRSGVVIASIDLSRGGLATSGDYEKFFECEGRRYCHLLDPATGWPVAHWQAISVVAPACLAAGVLATSAMLMGAQAPRYLRDQGVGFLCIDADGGVQRVSL